MAREPVITVDYYEITGSPMESGGGARPFTARRDLRCAWDDRLTLYDQLMGGYLDTDTGEWVLPAEYPWRDDCRVSAIEIEPWTSATGESPTVASAAVYAYAILHVTYTVSLVSFSPAENNLVVHSLRAGAEFLTRDPTDALYWLPESQQVELDAAPGIITNTVEWTVEIHEVKTVPATAYSLAGSVNQNAIATAYLPENSGFTAPAETLRYNGPQVRTEITTDGRERWLVTLSFSAKRATPQNVQSGDVSVAGWNHFYAPGQTAPERMWVSAVDRSLASIYEPYPIDDLNGLLAALGV